MEYFVSSEASIDGNGTADLPFGRIAEAAAYATPGDIVTIMPGIYREYIDPPRGGREDARIIYRAAIPGTVTVTGAEVAKGWQRYDGTVFSLEVSNSLFGSYNPFAEAIYGDWLTGWKGEHGYHAGGVYLNGKALYEAGSLEELFSDEPSPHAWDREAALYRWYAEVRDYTTVIYADFRGTDPDSANVEINVRRRCFFPSKTGVGYITLSGVEFTKAATTWAPPTAFQDGMVGPHWSRGWIIENCEISYSRCSGISLGKYLQENNENKWTRFLLKDGTQTEREAVCQAYLEGWRKELVGSHIVRNCRIHDCGQTGIVGHMGGAFSLIENNEIWSINSMGELHGAEIAGIKLHAAIDTVIRSNRIHHCFRGLWLDWQAQGTRVTGNLFYCNGLPEDVAARYPEEDPSEDLFIEVSHGPTTVDSNIMLSPFPFKIAAQGIAVINNLIAGPFTSVGAGTNNGRTDNPRYTPYHLPHDTAIMGFMTFPHGDDRFYGNIFIPSEGYRKRKERLGLLDGTIPFNDYPDEESYLERFRRASGERIAEDRQRYYDHFPVYAGGNVYFGSAKPMNRENAEIIDAVPAPLYEAKEGKIFINPEIVQNIRTKMAKVIATEDLGIAMQAEERFENPDGSSIVFDTDYHGIKRPDKPLPGPFSSEDSAKLPL